MPTKTKQAGTDRRWISHQLREVIEGDDRTAYGLGRDAGTDPGVIQRFLNRERGLTLETVDKLGLTLGLRLVETGRGRGRPAKVVRPVPAAPAIEEPEPIADGVGSADIDLEANPLEDDGHVGHD